MPTAGSATCIGRHSPRPTHLILRTACDSGDGVTLCFWPALPLERGPHVFRVTWLEVGPPWTLLSLMRCCLGVWVRVREAPPPTPPPSKPSCPGQHPAQGTAWALTGFLPSLLGASWASKPGWGVSALCWAPLSPWQDAPGCRRFPSFPLDLLLPAPRHLDPGHPTLQRGQVTCPRGSDSGTSAFLAAPPRVAAEQGASRQLCSGSVTALLAASTSCCLCVCAQPWPRPRGTALNRMPGHLGGDREALASWPQFPGHPWGSNSQQPQLEPYTHTLHPFPLVLPCLRH